MDEAIKKVDLERKRTRLRKTDRQIQPLVLRITQRCKWDEGPLPQYLVHCHLA